MENDTDKRPDTIHRQWVRRGCYTVLGLAGLLVLVLPIESTLFDRIPFLATMEQDHFGLRAFAVCASVIFGLIYFIPTIVAYNRWHNKVLYIFLANLLLGWSGIVLIGVLIWSLSNDISQPISARGELAELTSSRLSLVRPFGFLSVTALIVILLAMIFVSLSGNDPRRGTPDARSETNDSTSSRSE